jgi:hypothetical protein
VETNDVIEAYNNNPPQISYTIDLTDIKKAVDELSRTYESDSVEKQLHSLVLAIRERLVCVDVLGWKKANRQELIRQIDLVLGNIIGL